jgi:hypothetical protein
MLPKGLEYEASALSHRPVLHASRSVIAGVLAMLVFAVGAGCGSDTRPSAYKTDAQRERFRANASSAGLTAMFDCFDREGWRMELARDSEAPHRPLLLPLRVLEAMERVDRGVLESQEDLRATQSLPDAYIFSSASEATAHLHDFLGDPDLRAGTKPEQVGRTIFFWVATTNPWPDVAETMRKCAGES